MFTGSSQREKQMMARISELLAREEILEKQRSHTSTVALHAPNGMLVTGQEDLDVLASDFYSELFTAQPNSAPEEILALVPARVTN